MNEQKTLGILGTGLIGGSIGLRARTLGFRVLGYDAEREAAQSALQSGSIDELVDRVELYRRSGTVVIAAPVRATITELERLDPQTAARIGLLMDVASVKGPVVEAARRLRTFVGTHPMAGNERSGPASADAALFKGAAWAYVPSADAAVNRRAVAFIGALGAVAVEIDAATHDTTVARTSHMPQIFAWLYADRMRQFSDSNGATLSGPVARELLRIGSAKPPMWTDVLKCNAGNIARELQAMARALEREAESHILNTP